MNLSILIVDKNHKQNKNYSLFEKTPQEVFHVEYCDTLALVDLKYTTKKHDIIIINIDKKIQESLSFLQKNNSDNTKVIIISSNQENAIKFYKYNIIEYLVFPVDGSIFLIAILKAIQSLARFKNGTSNEIENKNRFNDFITISSMKKIEFIKIKDIVLLQADGKYTIVHLATDTLKLATRNLGEFQKLLDPQIFCRIHLKYIINLNKLLQINKSDGYYCEMENNKLIPVSKRRMDFLNKSLNISNM
jgi:two-component system LytT family response regulator